MKDAATVQPETAVAAVAAVASPISKSKITSNIGYTQQPAVFTKPVSVSPFRSSQSSSLPRLSINVEEPPPGKCDYLYMQLGSPLFSSRDLLMDTADTPHTAHTAHTAPVATAAAAVQVYPSDYDCLTVSEPHLMVPTYGNMHRKSSDNSLGATPMYHSGQPTGAVDYGISMGIGMGMGQDIAAAVTNSVSSERWVPHHADAIDDLLDFLGPLPGAQDLLFHCEDDEEEELDSSGGADGNRPAATATGEGTRMCAARETTITG